MRRLIQTPCEPHVQKALTARAAKVQAGDRVKPHWRSFTSLNAYEDLRRILRKPLGDRRRCSYCSDSRAADVEHFRPKEQYPQFAFEFDNFLLVCPECNRKKNDRFQIVNGHPAVINPLFDDPWDSLHFVPLTGFLDARIVSASGTRAPKGLYTLDLLGSILNGDPVLTGRKRTWGEIMGRLELVLDGTWPMGETQFETFDDIDDYGLSEWLLNREGKDLPEVLDLRQVHVSRWVQLRDLPRGP